MERPIIQRDGQAAMHSDAITYVVDDDQAMRDALRWLLESVGLSVVTFSCAREFLEQYDPDTPGCLVLDLRMPEMSGLELQETLLTREIAIPVVIITAFGEVAATVRAMRNGAVDVLEKPFSDQLLLDRIQQAIAADGRRRHRLARRSAIAERMARLTPQEQRVMELVVAGKRNKAIAADLGLSQKTVETHRSHVMHKLEADSIADLVRMVLDHGPSAKNA